MQVSCRIRSKYRRQSLPLSCLHWIQYTDVRLLSDTVHMLESVNMTNNFHFDAFSLKSSFGVRNKWVVYFIGIPDRVWGCCFVIEAQCHGEFTKKRLLKDDAELDLTAAASQTVSKWFHNALSRKWPFNFYVVKTLTCNSERVLILFPMQWRQPIIAVADYCEAFNDTPLKTGSFRLRVENNHFTHIFIYIKKFFFVKNTLLTL